MAEIPLFLGLGGLIGYMIAETGEIDRLTGESQYDLLELRDPDSLSTETRRVIDLITIQDNINPVGSYKFKIHKYPSDIDLFEKYKTCCDLKTATKDISTQLRKIAHGLKNAPNIYFGDFRITSPSA